MQSRRLPRSIQLAFAAVCLSVVIVALIFSNAVERTPRAVPTDVSSQSRANNAFRPTVSQRNAIETAPVSRRSFRLEFATEGKIAVNEDRATPVFSPYAGRVIRLFAKPGEHVAAGHPLFMVESSDTVQGLNDYVAALSTMNSARAKLNLAQIAEKRANDLYAGKAVPLKDWQQTQADLAAAQNDMRSSETAVEAARNRLKILGRSDQEIATFQETREIRADTTIRAPIAGTVVQRKVGPGQYLSVGATDPAYLIGDLSTVWLAAFVRETDAANVRVGQNMSFHVPAVPAREYRATIDYVASAIDPTNRRLLVRATVDNSDGVLKPEMFANVTLYVEVAEGSAAIGIPRDAIIYEGPNPTVWVRLDDQVFERRPVRLGLTNGQSVQVVQGLSADDQVVTRGALFINRAASGG